MISKAKRVRVIRTDLNTGQKECLSEAGISCSIRKAVLPGVRSGLKYTAQA